MRIVHVSDLHFGHHDEALAAGLAADIARQEPGLIVVSGDFTQYGTEAEFIRAREFLDSLAVPVFAVPGNHDVPARNLIRRFLNPYGYYRTYIARDLEPRMLHRFHQQRRDLRLRQGEHATEVGEALADQALGGVDQEHARLQPGLALDEVGLLPGVLEVVARVRLVGERAQEVEGPDRQVRVDVHA